MKQRDRRFSAWYFISFLNFFSLVNNNFGPARRPFACSATTTLSMYIAKCVAQAATNKQNKQNFLRAAALRICEHAVQLSLLPPLRHSPPPPPPIALLCESHYRFEQEKNRKKEKRRKGSPQILLVLENEGGREDGQNLPNHNKSATQPPAPD